VHGVKNEKLSAQGSMHRLIVIFVVPYCKAAVGGKPRQLKKPVVPDHGKQPGAHPWVIMKSKYKQSTLTTPQHTHR